MGDVAMIVPVLKNVLEQNHDIHITLVTRKFFSPFFENIERLSLKEIDLKERHKGIIGLYRLSQELNKEKFDVFADLHNVLRTKIIRVFLKFSIPKIKAVNKGRQEKKELTRKEHKISKPLKTTIERYADVFRELGINVEVKQSLNQYKENLDPELISRIQFDSNKTNIGIAPFAQHEGKIYPLNKIEKIALELVENKNIHIYLFGGGKKEQELLDKIANKNNQVFSLVGKTKLNEELKIISNLQLMISMDSSNMHMASLKGTPVISFWGATHPNAGFMGFGQSDKNSIQRNDLTCRPCSVYGNKPCWRGDWACLDINESVFVEKVKLLLK